MKRSKHKELILLLLTFASVVTLFATRNVSMADTTLYMILGLFAVGVMGYGSYAWLERPADEREKELVMIASKHAYLVSSLVLAVGIIVQSLNHTLDMWLPMALGASLAVKLISFFIHRREQE